MRAHSTHTAPQSWVFQERIDGQRTRRYENYSKRHRLRFDRSNNRQRRYWAISIISDIVCVRHQNVDVAAAFKWPKRLEKISNLSSDFTCTS